MCCKKNCYTTDKNRRITCVDLHKTDLNGDRIVRFALSRKQGIDYVNSN